MAQPIIKVENLSKLYRLGTINARTMYDSFENWWKRIRKVDYGNGRLNQKNTLIAPDDPQAGSEPNTLWALKDVSFNIRKGEVVGIIGKNGAGKSTLLKILSRITEPTSGQAIMKGRVSSLLEVGTGFHPELTGRENIYLNGAILGMRKIEIDQKLDEIVAFAEVERFIETPVKRYSSGMYVRLAFAVAAHLEPEILIVDEVLAVGDVSFQKKCLNKLKDSSQSGRTVIFVSHNMTAVTRICENAILLDKSRIVASGPAHEMVSTYLGNGQVAVGVREWDSLMSAPGNDIVRLRAVKIINEHGEAIDAVDVRKPVGMEMEYEVLMPGHVLTPNFHFFNQEGICAFIVSDQDPAWRRKPKPKGCYKSTAWIPGNLLAEGSLVVGAAMSTMDPVGVHFYERDLVAFQIVDSLDGDSARGDYGGLMPGVVRPMLRWTTDFKPHSSGNGST